MVKQELFVKVGRILEGEMSYDVIPVLIVLSARALAQEANGDSDQLSKRLKKFHTLMTNEAVEMLEEEEHLQ
jgi:hypothetical protein